MSKLPKISVITPSFNQGNFIERTILSVIGQDYPNLEYIVVDGGSTDSTLEVLRKYEARLRWISEKDKGQSDAINKGIRMASGDIIAYLNSDDVYEKGALKKAAGFFAANPSAMWVCGRCRIIDVFDKEARAAITRYKNFLLKRYDYNILLITNFISQPATFLRMEAVREFGPFDVTLHRVMDYAYWVKVGGKYRPGIIDDYLAGFRVHGASKTSKEFWRSFREEYEVAKKHSPSRLINALHYMSYIGICCVYTAMGFISRIKGIFGKEGK